SDVADRPLACGPGPENITFTVAIVVLLQRSCRWSLRAVILAGRVRKAQRHGVRAEGPSRSLVAVQTCIGRLPIRAHTKRIALCAPALARTGRRSRPAQLWRAPRR